MLFLQTCIFFLCYFVLLCQALRCLTNCSIKFNLTIPFNIPNQCNQFISAGQCLASLDFWYDTQEYMVNFYAESSSIITIVNDRRHVSLSVSSITSSYFSYTIFQACKNKDNCARDLAMNTANEILERRYDLSTIMNELKPLILGPSLTPDNSILNCYNSNQNVHQCGTLNVRGLCVILHKIKENLINRSCGNGIIDSEVSVFIQQFRNNDATFTVRCNRTLCNELSTLQAVKELMFKYNITVTLDGRLNHSSRFMISTLLILIMIISLRLISNQS